jgi:3-hydroxyisobutyrate dehydrogenase
VTITRVGFIGLGNMGSPMAAHLVDAGFSATVSDSASGVTERFVAEHPTAVAAAGRESFADVQALILMLPTSDIVEAVLEREGVADALRPGCLVIDMSSSEPLRTRSLAARLQAKGLSMLDAPV